jgi:ADP-heptose:LPS heptosyltransferase
MRVRVGILKPDHLGDLILSAPAVAALRRRFDDVTLLCHPKSLALANYLFPGMPARPMQLPHLDKNRGFDTTAKERLKLLRDEIDLLICLRWDGQMERLLSIPEIEYHTPNPHSDKHVAAEHHDIVMPFTRAYDILESFNLTGFGQLASRPKEINSVGLCISAGYHLNAWPMYHWLQLAERFHRDGYRLVLLGGPAEAARLSILAETMQSTLGLRPDIIRGGNDFQATLQQLHELVDLVVATDSGTAHLAALVRPVVSLFGGSPWQRFAPLGPHNLILSRRYHCSPCIQFYRVALNTCHTQECLNGLTPKTVYHCIRAYLDGVDLSTDLNVDGGWMSQSPWQTKPQSSAAANDSTTRLKLSARSAA